MTRQAVRSWRSRKEHIIPQQTQKRRTCHVRERRSIFLNAAFCFYSQVWDTFQLALFGRGRLLSEYQRKKLNPSSKTTHEWRFFFLQIFPPHHYHLCLCNRPDKSRVSLDSNCLRSADNTSTQQELVGRVYKLEQRAGHFNPARRGAVCCFPPTCLFF